MKIYIDKSWNHSMNKKSLIEMLNILKWEIVKSIENADVIYSPCGFINPNEYENKLFIFGPHISAFNPHKIKTFNFKYNNCFLMHPSQPTVNLWVDKYKYNKMPVFSFAFGIDTKLYYEKQPIQNRDGCFVYYKQRKSSELDFILNDLNVRDINYTLINYGKYDEKNYKKLLEKCKYGIWISRHESQGVCVRMRLVV